MTVVNMLQAKTHLSRLVGEIESGAEPDIVIARNGKPVSRIAPVDPGSTRGKRLGLLEGLHPSTSRDEFDASNEAIGQLLRGDP